MTRKIVKFITLSLGVISGIVGSFIVIKSIINDVMIANMNYGFLYFCLGFILLGISLLIVSKDTIKEKKLFRNLLKILAIYWIISGLIASIILIFSY